MYDIFPKGGEKVGLTSVIILFLLLVSTPEPSVIRKQFTLHLSS